MYRNRVIFSQFLESIFSSMLTSLGNDASLTNDIVRLMVTLPCFANVISKRKKRVSSYY